MKVRTGEKRHDDDEYCAEILRAGLKICEHSLGIKMCAKQCNVCQILDNLDCQSRFKISTETAKCELAKSKTNKHSCNI